MPKLTLNIAEEVVKRAKRLADRRRTSVSRLVEQFLDLASRDGSTEPSQGPVLSELRGSLRGANPAGYRKYVERKYR